MVTNGAIRHAKFPSKRHHQQTNTLPDSVNSAEGKSVAFHLFAHPKLTRKTKEKVVAIMILCTVDVSFRRH